MSARVCFIIAVFLFVLLVFGGNVPLVGHALELGLAFIAAGLAISGWNKVP